MRIFISLALGLLVAAGLAGCDDPKAKVQLHEAGKYLGKVDPLLEKSKNGANDKALQERFAQIQRDR